MRWGGLYGIDTEFVAEEHCKVMGAEGAEDCVVKQKSSFLTFLDALGAQDNRAYYGPFQQGESKRLGVGAVVGG